MTEGLSGRGFNEDVLRSIFREKGLSPNAQRILRYLLFERDRGDGKRITAHDQQIATSLGIARETVSRRKAELVKRGFLRIRKQTFDHRTGKYQSTQYDLRPGLKLIKAKYGVSHGSSRMDRDSTTDRVTVSHGEEGGCLTVESETGSELATDRVTGEPCDGLSHVSKDTKEQGTSAVLEGDVPTPLKSNVPPFEEENGAASTPEETHDRISKFCEVGKAALEQARMNRQKRASP